MNGSDVKINQGMKNIPCLTSPNFLNASLSISDVVRLLRPESYDTFKTNNQMNIMKDKLNWTKNDLINAIDNFIFIYGRGRGDKN